MMGMNIAGKSFLTLLDYTTEEIHYLLDLSKSFKMMKQAGIKHRYLDGKNAVLLFEKTSTRTRCAFEVAGMDLGMGITYLDPKGSQMGTKESIEDTAKVLGRMFDGIEYRGYAQKTVEDLAKYSGVPVWNGLTDQFHPTQMLADVMTIQEKIGADVKGKKLVFMGDARNNVANSLMVISAKLGMHFVACGPKDRMPDSALVETCRRIAAETGSVIELEENAKAATKNADVIYTDIWLSMGEDPKLWKERINELRPYQVNKELIENAKSTVLFEHCLPSFHDLNTAIGQQIHADYGLDAMEVTDEVFRGHHSVVFDEAENRMHTIKAIMYATLK